MQRWSTPASIPRPRSTGIPFLSGRRGALTAHNFQSVKLKLRIHCKLRKPRNKAPPTLAASCRTQTKDFVIQRDEKMAGYF
jgi:hypothetical protein